MSTAIPLLSALALSAALTACDTARNGGAAAAAEPEVAVAESEPQPRNAQRESAKQRTAQAQTPDAESGKLKFNNFCRTCHSLNEGDHRLGPSLHGVIGRKAGTAPGYGNYSQALTSSGIVWDEQTLDRFLANPDAVVPGNNMKPFSRLPDPRVRQDIIAHIEAAGGESGAED